MPSPKPGFLVTHLGKKKKSQCSSLTTAPNYDEMCFPPCCPVYWTDIIHIKHPRTCGRFQIMQNFLHLPKIKLFNRQYVPSSLLLPCHCKCLGSNQTCKAPNFPSSAPLPELYLLVAHISHVLIKVNQWQNFLKWQRGMCHSLQWATKKPLNYFAHAFPVNRLSRWQAQCPFP